MGIGEWSVDALGHTLKRHRETAHGTKQWGVKSWRRQSGTLCAIGPHMVGHHAIMAQYRRRRADWRSWRRGAGSKRGVDLSGYSTRTYPLKSIDTAYTLLLHPDHDEQGEA